MFEQEHRAGTGRQRPCADQSTLMELVKVLAAHPGGLRRWSVMRAIRKERENAAQDIPQKFEDEVERTFRQFCADSDDGKVRRARDALFYKPRERAGEVWAIFPDRAEAWLNAEAVEAD
ncbi:MAG: hypothetical protein KGJ79_05375 [Alphaproteobacteria bacterium]|nr:hypothetical protein [Alphaproteobacteria bacterium]MDE2492720.1 hypothetical protein [Alphaproteobacteria bacterium]